jgi:hypothetical protein
MHTHQLVPLKIIQDDYTIYWCRECGLVCERIGTNIYEMIPSWSEGRLVKENRKSENYKFLPKPDKPYRQKVRLGRTLKEIKSRAPTGLFK